jgi:hypothetical protein
MRNAIIIEETKAVCRGKERVIRVTESGKTAEQDAPANPKARNAVSGEWIRETAINARIIDRGRDLQTQSEGIRRIRTTIASRVTANAVQKMERANVAWGKSIRRSS